MNSQSFSSKNIPSGRDRDLLSANVAPISQEADFHEIGQEEPSTSGPSGASYESGSRSGVPSLRRLSRAFFMPSQSQLGHWQRPSRSFTNSKASAIAPFAADSPISNQLMYTQELSLELADSVQAAVQTLLQLSPPHLFDPAKEQFSACAVQIPTPSMAGLLTSMKNLNYISANMGTLGGRSGESSMPPDGNPKHERLAKDTFDIGEVLQSVGDSLGGVVAEAEVDLVLHHGDTIRHMGVKGDECGISYALSHIIFQVIDTTRPGDNVEIGLCINEQPVLPDDPCTHSESSNEASPSSRVQDVVVCTFKITHRFSPFLSDESPPDLSYSATSDLDTEAPSCHSGKRPDPHFNTTIFTRLLRQINGTLQTSFQDRPSPDGRRFEFAITLEHGPSLSDIHRRTPPAEDETFQPPCPDIPFAREPSIDELTGFAETLRYKRVVFHASSRGLFAHHLTRYLVAWGMDISHVPTDGAEEQDPAEDTSSAQVQSGFGSLTSSPRIGVPISGNGLENVPPIIDSASDGLPEVKSTPSEAGLSLIIIDDDVLVLRRRLLQHRAEAMPNLNLQSRKRPSLAAHHRQRSSPSVRNPLLVVGGQQQQSSPSATPLVPIVHFTSLANYKLVKDAIQAFLILTPTSPPIHPEVIVIPKPAGPRRILAALHTAFNKPIVDPFFLPIATSPMSPMSPTSTMSSFMPGRKSFSGFAPSTGSRSSGEPLPWATPESVATLSTATPPLPSPLSYPEGLEYFCDGSRKQLGGNAASGLVIQSPDGRPAGIFFHPPSRMSSSKSDLAMTTMERERTVSRPSQRSIRRSTQMIRTDAIEASKETTSRHGAPSSPWLVVPASRPSLPSTVSSPPERPRFGDQTDLLRSYKGRGRPGISPAREVDSTRALPSATWREAAQISPNQPLTTVASLEANRDPAASTSASQSPTDPTSSPTRLISNLEDFAQTARSPTSQTSPEPKRSGIRRANPGTKSPIGSKNVKKPKSVGSNIVPPISVLIVEDNAINQTILSTFMRRNKIKYEVAWNGREAIEKWRHGNFHLILMDIQMPVMDGIEATKEIRRLERAENICSFPPTPNENSRHSVETPDSRPSSTASTPFRSQVIIVALTASSLQSDRVAALAAGCNDFLTKPVTNSWLNDKIIEWGSIKALQMWAELRPEVAKTISRDQVAKAQDVARKLHVPVGSARGSPLRDAHVPLPDHSQDTGESEEGDGSSRRVREATGFSEKRGSSFDSSPERWPMSSDDDLTQDPITEPPAVIVTPVRSTIELPEVENEPRDITGQEALYQFWKQAHQESHSSPTPRPALLGQRARSSTSTASISSVVRDTPGT